MDPIQYFIDKFFLTRRCYLINLSNPEKFDGIRLGWPVLLARLGWIFSTLSQSLNLYSLVVVVFFLFNFVVIWSSNNLDLFSSYLFCNSSTPDFLNPFHFGKSVIKILSCVTISDSIHSMYFDVLDPRL